MCILDLNLNFIGVFGFLICATNKNHKQTNNVIKVPRKHDIKDISFPAPRLLEKNLVEMVGAVLARCSKFIASLEFSLKKLLELAELPKVLSYEMLKLWGQQA